MSDKLTDRSAQPSEEAKKLAAELYDTLKGDSYAAGHDCGGGPLCDLSIIAKFADRVSREALERAAGLDAALHKIRDLHTRDAGYSFPVCATNCSDEKWPCETDRIAGEALAAIRAPRPSEPEPCPGIFHDPEICTCAPSSPTPPSEEPK